MSRLAVAGIMPLYNQGSTVLEAIESALNQTRAIDELIVVDDGSTDGSGDLVAQRYGHNTRVRLIRQANRGAGVARNAGIMAARSELNAFLDADDRWLPHRIEVQAAFMEKHPSCMLSFSAHISHNEATGKTVVENEEIDKTSYLEKGFFQEIALPACDTIMIRREVLDEVGGFDESLRKCQDTDLWLRIMVRFGFGHIPLPLAWVRRGPRQTRPADLAKVFFWHDRYFAKHRYAFGHGPRAERIWRSAYSAVRRKEAHWYLRHKRGREGLTTLLRATCIWPFFDPTITIKTGLEYLLGSTTYDEISLLLKGLLGRPVDKDSGRKNCS